MVESLGVRCLLFRVSGLEFGPGGGCSCSAIHYSSAALTTTARVSGFGFRVQGSGFGV